MPAVLIRTYPVVYRLLLIGATIILLFSFAVYCAYAANLISFPYDYDQGEGFELVDTILFSKFEWPYQNTDSYPFYSSNYPPLFHVMIAPFVWLFGEAYWYGRLLGFIGTLITASTIALAVHKSAGQRWISLLSGIAFLSSNTIYHIGPLLRQHMTMVMFETLAVVIIADAYPKRKTSQVIVGLILLVAAGYTKQLAAITAVAVVAWMILRQPLTGILYSLLFSIVGAIIFVWMNVSTGGEWWRQAIIANVNAFDPFQMFGLIFLWLRLHALLIVPAVLLALYEIYFERISLYSVWFIFAAILGAVGSGKWGAGDSYFATSIAALCILSGIFFSRIVTNTWTLKSNHIASKFIDPFRGLQPGMRMLAVLMIPVLYTGYGVATLKMPTKGVVFGPIASAFRIEPNVLDRHYDSATYAVTGYANIGHFVTQTDRDAGDYITRQIIETDGPVLSEEAGFNLAAGRKVITNPTQLRNLWLAGFWNGIELLDMIETQTFKLIILRAQFYPVPVLEIMGQHYSVTETISMNGFEYWLLRPNS